MDDLKQLVNKMGWNDMPATVAEDAARCILHNRRATIADCCDELLCLDAVLEVCLSDEITVDNLWLDLYIDSYDTLCDEEGQKVFASLRGEIEDCMKSGMIVDDAISEWFK